VYCEVEQLDKAIEHLQKALSLKKGNEKFSIEKATCFNNLATAYRKSKKKNEAVQNIELALKFFGTDTSPEMRKNLAQVYKNKADCFYDFGNAQEALSFYQLALETEKARFGELSKFCFDIYEKIGKHYQDDRYFAEAKKYFEKSLFISRYIFGLFHPNTLATQSKLELLNSSLDAGKTLPQVCE